MLHHTNEIAVASGFVDLRRQADVLLLANRDYDRDDIPTGMTATPTARGRSWRRS